jgi:hypothetical protein
MFALRSKDRYNKLQYLIYQPDRTELLFNSI